MLAAQHRAAGPAVLLFHEHRGTVTQCRTADTGDCPHDASLQGKRSVPCYSAVVSDESAPPDFSSSLGDAREARSPCWLRNIGQLAPPCFVYKSGSRPRRAHLLFRFYFFRNRADHTHIDSRQPIDLPIRCAYFQKISQKRRSLGTRQFLYLGNLNTGNPSC